jgi:hypothetical protein
MLGEVMKKSTCFAAALCITLVGSVGSAAADDKSDANKRLVMDGDLVAVHYRFKVKPDDRGMAVVDIFRVANGKIQEHWDVAEPVPEKSANTNGMF